MSINVETNLARWILQMTPALSALHRQGLLLPLLRRERDRAALLVAARELVSVSVEELQAAADHVRRSRGLTSATDTERWLAAQRLTVADWEEGLEEELLLAKLKAHVTRDAVAAALAEQPTAYSRVRFRHLLTDSADLAHELRAQVNEGADFVRLAADHSRDAAGGRAITAFRCDLGYVAELLFDVPAGTVVGPHVTPSGSHLYLVEEVRAASADAETAATVRERAFAHWVAERTRHLPEVDLPR